MGSNGPNNYSQCFGVSKNKKYSSRIQGRLWLPEDIYRFIQLAVNVSMKIVNQKIFKTILQKGIVNEQLKPSISPGRDKNEILTEVNRKKMSWYIQEKF